MPFPANTWLKRKGPWTIEEDELLSRYIEANGIGGCWRNVPKRAGLLRSGKSCRLRWVNYLHPDLKHGNMTAEETDLIVRIHNLIGNRWSLIAARLPGRTDNEIKNFWKCYLRKKNAEDLTESKFKKGSKKRTRDSTNQTPIIEELPTDTNLRSLDANTVPMCNPILGRDVVTTLSSDEIHDEFRCRGEGKRLKKVPGVARQQELTTTKTIPPQDGRVTFELMNIEGSCHVCKVVSSPNVNSKLSYNSPRKITLNRTESLPLQVDADTENSCVLLQTRSSTSASSSYHPFMQVVSNSESLSFDSSYSSKSSFNLADTPTHEQTKQPTSESETQKPCYPLVSFRESSSNDFQYPLLSSRENASFQSENQHSSTQHNPTLHCSFFHTTGSENQITERTMPESQPVACGRGISVDQIENLTWQELADLVTNPGYQQTDICMQDDVLGDAEPAECGCTNWPTISSWEKLDTLFFKNLCS